ncbi:NTP transferase domain-containing protein [Paludisphaera rhizosphaerae]|uniref:NTP transferase domain-containing protein n=1 Tax=Paludisphaera rhizosphaerae TaxID=2711216 RepID=UPI00197FAC7E|nr:NTP transferase domain-containing protein [Paludisphaera rhizosphaerae]
MTVAAIIPAAGESRRMGRAKLLIEFGGRPLIARVVNALREGGAGPIVVVTPPFEAPEGPPIAEAAAQVGARVLTPERRPGDMRESVELALAALNELRDKAPGGVLLAPADSPRLKAATVGRLIDAWLGRPESIFIPTFGGRRGHPIVLPWRIAISIPNLPGGVGVNALISEHAADVQEIPFDDDAVLVDLDTPDDLDRLRRTRSVRLFAIARQLAGVPEVVVELPESATVVDLRRALIQQHPALAGIAERVRIAVGDEYAGDDAVIPADVPLALIPPVSGG